MAKPSRHRATVDLHGMEERLQAFAAARRMTVAATVRRALDALLAGEGEQSEGAPLFADRADDGPLVKVTLRLPALHTRLLAWRARKADVSQGDYVARLVEGAPLTPPMPDHVEVVAALNRSTAGLAALCLDLHAVTRLLRRDGVSDLGQHEGRLSRLENAVGEHVRLASQLIAEVSADRHRPAHKHARSARAERPT